MAIIAHKCSFCIVKRAGHHEEFDERKLYASCYAACISAHMDKRLAEKVCAKAILAVKRRIRKRKSIDSDELFRMAVEELRKLEKHAAYMYETHRDIA
jgi:transcriptional regulator NrdR family protein